MGLPLFFFCVPRSPPTSAGPRFVDAGAAALIKSLPPLLSSDPRGLLESEFIDKIEPDQALFALPATAPDDPARLPATTVAAG
ncbi:MAG: hypothetical protein DVS81_14085 [Candidatus Accumulibacter meliphilus]|uniref:Uncharacterized protein n=1 Tax=Candidatus Accumulibacter meliphilus TaxID=2211374 RepID=A0A369XM50_9PROT|nr:MAG: hypothetical protein DVS81_14085 [Candidatus Accumulibacter meliphilus]